MGKKILVPLAQNDRVEEMIPYIEKVARAGMNVVFLVRYPVNGFLRAQGDYGVSAALQARRLVNYYSWENNLETAKRKLSHACEALRAIGVEATVEVYASRLKNAVRHHTVNGDVHLIMTRAMLGDRIAVLVDGTASFSKLFKRPRFSPVLLTQVRTLH